MNDAEDYRRAAEAVLTELGRGQLATAGKPYRLGEAALAHADLEAGRTHGALYLSP